MRTSFFADDHLMITPLCDADGVRLRLEGELGVAHHVPLARAVTASVRVADEITVDCRRVTHMSTGILHTLIALAGDLHPPQSLRIQAHTDLGLVQECARQGWDILPTLRLDLDDA